MKVTNQSTPVNGERADRESLRAQIDRLTRQIERLRESLESPDTPQMLTKEEVADLLGVSERTVDKLIAANELQSLKIRRSRRIPAEAVESYVRERL